LEEEMSQVRAKFRCLSVTKKWDKTLVVELGPVVQSKHNKENSQFWKFTPSGDMTLNFRGPSFDAGGKEFVPGDYYYIDMVKDEEGGWGLTTVTNSGPESGSVELNTRGGKYTADWGENGFSYGKMTMGIDNPSAFKAFDPVLSHWAVTIAWAEASDD